MPDNATENSRLLLSSNNTTEFTTTAEESSSARAGAGGAYNSSCRWWRLVQLSIVAFLILVATYSHYESHDQKEIREIQKYAKEADQAIELLNEWSSSSLNRSSSIPEGCESTILIFRHCEDLGGHVRYEDDGTSHCSYLGFQRSLYLATLFGSDGSSSERQNNNDSSTTTNRNCRWPMPSKLYGLWNKDKTNKRQFETLRPLSDKSGVAIEMFDFDTASENVRSELFELLSNGNFCNQVVVMAWKHAYIRELAATLGCDLERGCPNSGYDDYDFDTVWEIQYVYQPEQLRAYPYTETIRNHTNKYLVNGWQVYGSVTKEYFDALEFKRTTYKDRKNGSSWMQHNEHG